MLDQYNRDSAYFQSLRDRNMTVARNDLDLSFNNVIDYINNQILPVVKQLVDKKAVGIQSSPDRFLRNIGNGSTKFDIIRNNDIVKHTLNLNKFIHQTPLGIIANNVNGDLQSYSSQEENQVLISGDNLVPIWKKLDAQNLVDRAVTSTKISIETLSARHLAPGIIGKPLNEDSIETRFIQDNTITGDKVASGSFSNSKISEELMNTRAASSDLVFEDKCFVSRTIANNSVDIKKIFFYKSNTRFPTNLYGILTPANIPINSIELKQVLSTNQYIKFNVRDQMDGSIIQTKIKANSLSLQVIRAGFPDWVSISSKLKLSKNNLSPEVKAILVNRGGLTP